MGYNPTRNQTFTPAAKEAPKKTPSASATAKIIENKTKDIEVPLKVVGFTVTKPLHEAMKSYSKSSGIKINMIVKKALKAWFNNPSDEILTPIDIHRNSNDIKKFSCKIPEEYYIKIRQEVSRLNTRMSPFAEEVISNYLNSLK